MLDINIDISEEEEEDNDNDNDNNIQRDNNDHDNEDKEMIMIENHLAVNCDKDEAFGERGNKYEKENYEVNLHGYAKQVD